MGSTSVIEEPFDRTDTLTSRKLREFIPVMILTNMSVFVLSTLDSLVAGNLVGSDALASVQIFTPVQSVIGALTVWLAAGAGTSMSTCMGRNDVEAMRRTKNAIKATTLVAAAIVAVIQLPIIHIIIGSYNLDPDIRALVWQYALGMMVASPIGIISSAGSYQLTILGKMRPLMRLSLGESIINLLLDLLFVEVMHLGVAGIGFGTAVANVARCAATLAYLAKDSDLLKRNALGVRLGEVRDILRCGAPEATSTMTSAIANCFMTGIILDAFGADGGVIKGVCFLAFSINNIVNLGIRDSMRPLLGLYSGSGDVEAIRSLMRRCTILTILCSGALTLLTGGFPGFVYRLNGVQTIPTGGALSLRLYALSFVLFSMNALFRLYFANRKDSTLAIVLAVTAYAILSLAALALYHLLPAPFIWLAYLASEAPALVGNVCRYLWWRRRDVTGHDPKTKMLYLSAKPQDAVEASQFIEDFTARHGYPHKVSFRMRLCMEEMVAYVVASQQRPDTEIQIMVRLS